MTRTFKIMAGVILAASVTGGAFQVHEFREQAANIATLQQEATHWRQEVFKLQAERATALAAAAAKPIAIVELELSSSDAGFDANLRSLVARVTQLKEYLAQHPDEWIPQFRFLNDIVWFQVAQRKNLLGKEFEFGRSMGELRAFARMEFAKVLSSALKAFLKASNGRIPADIVDLTPFFVTSVDDDLLRRYEMRASGLAANLPKGSPLISEKPDDLRGAGPDPPYEFSVDGIQEASAGKFLGARFGGTPSSRVALSKAIQAYRLAHKGEEPPDEQNLLPYFKNSADGEKFLDLQKRFRVRPEGPPGSYVLEELSP